MADHPPGVILLLAALACYRISRLIVEDAIFDPVRLWIWRYSPPGTFAGDLIDCAWCTSMWVGTAMSLALWVSGVVVLEPLAWILLPFAFSAVAGILSRGD